jgi:acyl-CoA thioesterase-1
MHVPAAPNVLFIGDSVTHAHRMPNEFHDCYQLGSGYVNSVAAELTAAEPGAGYRFLNRGQCGDTVGHLLERWDADCLAATPAIVSILVGINDAQPGGARPDEFRQGYTHLLDRTRQRLPAAQLVVMEPFGLPVKPDAALAVISPAQLGRLGTLQPIVAAVAAAAGAIFVPLQSAFDQASVGSLPAVWARDGIHPSAGGHWLIARAWVAAARQAGLFPQPARAHSVHPDLSR